MSVEERARLLAEQIRTEALARQPIGTNAMASMVTLLARALEREAREAIARVSANAPG